MDLFSLRNRLKSGWKMFLVAVMANAILAGCNDNNETTIVDNTPFDPSKPVAISSFIPESGSAYEQIIINGSNFGTKKENVSLLIGGKDAVVINVMPDKIYAFVPPQAFSGEISLTIYDDNGNLQSTTSPRNFNYEALPVVGTLCGYQNDNDTQGEVWGSFDICSGFQYEGMMAIDPLYPNRLYIAYDTGNGFLAQLDLESRECTRMMSANKFQNKRLRNIDFTLDGKYMLVSTDRDDNNFNSTSVWIVERRADGTFNESSQPQQLAAYKQCNGVAVHPVNGEVYFNSYSNGELFRLDIDSYFKAVTPDPETGETAGWTGSKENGCFRELFKIKDPSFEFATFIHPSGDYAYLVVINRSYILRTDYNWQKKEFMTPYVIAGSNGEGGWVDAVGTTARVSRPYQGVFVKNPEYEAQGKPDVYDFYFADCTNFCIRYITPEGIVRTYAGRAPSTNGNIWGTEDGALRTAARFRDVTGITYDYQRERFYVLDHNNRRIRTIGKESDDLIMNEGGDDEGEGEGDEESEPESEE